MSDEPSQFASDEDAGAEPPVSVPPQLPILPLRDTVLFPTPSCLWPWPARVRFG